MITLKLCPRCGGKAVILPRPEPDTDGVRAQCLSCGAHTQTVSFVTAGDMKNAYKTVLTLWNEGVIE